MTMSHVGELMPDVRLDRGSPVPLYFQLALQLEQAIEDGRLAEATQWANEMTIADQLRLSRPTVRQAMQHLVDRGLIVRRRGIGTRVVASHVRRRVQLSSLYADLDRAGQRPSTAVLSLRQVDGPSDVRAALAVAQDEQIWEVVRIRSANDRPIAHLTNYLIATGLELTAGQLQSGSLYGVMAKAGLDIHSGVQTIGARNASAEEAKLLAAKRGEAMLTVERTVFDDSGRALELGRHLYVANRYAFTMNLPPALP